MTGENYRFGYKASGDATELVKLCEEFGLSAFIVRSVMDTAKRSLNGFSGAINSSDKGQVSSSRVRHALAMGDMEYVSELLGRKHRLLLMVNQHCLHEKKSIVLPNSCMLNMPPAEGLYENCDLVNGGYLGPCRVIINSDTIIIGMKLYTFCICHLVEIIAERRHWGEYCKGKSKTLFKRAVRLIVIEFRSIL
jgi:FAD synthetase